MCLLMSFKKKAKEQKKKILVKSIKLFRKLPGDSWLAPDVARFIFLCNVRVLEISEIRFCQYLSQNREHALCS